MIIRRQRLVRLLVVDVLDAVAGVVVAAAEGLGVADRLRPGEGVDEGQATRKALLQPRHQRMIIGEGRARGLEPVVERYQLPLEDGEREQAAQVGIDRRWNDRVRRARFASVEILPAVEPCPLTARVRDLGDEVIPQLLLDAEIPVLDVSIPEIDTVCVWPWSE